MTIRSKLILWYSGLLTAIIIGFGVSVFLVSRWTLINSVDTTLDETVDAVLKNSSAELVREFGSPARIVVFFSELDIFRASGVVMQVWDISEDEPRFLPQRGKRSASPGYRVRPAGRKVAYRPRYPPK